MNMVANVVPFVRPSSVSILEVPLTKRIVVPCRKKQWGSMQDTDEYPLVRWIKILGAAAAMHQPWSCSFVPTTDLDTTRKFLDDYTVSWQSFHTIDRLCDIHARSHLEKVERVRCWRGINAKLSRWVKYNPKWRDNLFWVWGTNTFRPGFDTYVEDIASIIRKGVVSYCTNRSVR